MDTKIALVCVDNEDRNVYQDALKLFDVSTETVSTFRELQSLLMETPHNGVMVDMKTKIRAPRSELKLAYEILRRYPVVQLSLDDETREIRTLSDGKSKHDTTLKAFIDNDCRPFKARAIRSSPRKPFHFNVLLSRAEEIDKTGVERTITFNVSLGGCFILSTQEWAINKLILFQILDLEDRTPITAEVRWFKPWGLSTGIPGIGVQFKGIKDKQLKEIARICKL